MPSNNVILWWLLSSLVFCLCASDENPELLVKLPNGLVRGKDNNGLYLSWQSIPYAEPPVGELRFEAPQPYRQLWSDVFDATRTPPNCMQWDQFREGDNKLQGSEDCLTVNIFKPNIRGGGNYPVMVFIHGGCFMFGSVSIHDPAPLMASGQIIFVTISYRVGPLGFLSTEDEIIPGNYGLKDQQLALQWIKNNIHRFGGNPNKILLSGFSAGGASTHLHMLQSPEKNVAKAAMSISGVALNPWVLMKNARAKALKLAALLNCPSENGVELKSCLKLRKAEDIVSAVSHFQNIGYNPFSIFGPVVEHENTYDAFLTQHPVNIIKSGNYAHIPWIASYVLDDGGYNAAELMSINPNTGQELMYELNDNWLDLLPENLFLVNIHDNPQAYARSLKEHYLGNSSFWPENYGRVSNMYTDVLFKDGILESLKLHSQYSHAPVYGYVYDNPADYSVGRGLSRRTDVRFGK